MMAISHGLVGAAIATAVPDPILSGGLILVSHYLLDLIPHWDFGTDWKKRSVTQTGLMAIGDTIAAYVVTYILFHNQLSMPVIFLAVSISNLPDWLIAPYFMFFSSKDGYHKSRGGSFGSAYGKFLEFEETFMHTKAKFTQGVLTQITTILFFFFLLGKNK
jgi:hypothetical protein